VVQVSLEQRVLPVETVVLVVLVAVLFWFLLKTVLILKLAPMARLVLWVVLVEQVARVD
jgi:hypothetical protein